jgi:hypothetical protein
MENVDNLSKNIDADIKIYLPSFSHSAGTVSDAILKVRSGQSLGESCSRDNLKKIFLFLSILKYLQRGFEV